MTGSARIFILLVMCIGTAGLSCPCRAADDSRGLLEQSKQLLADRSNDGQEWIEEKTGQYLPLDLPFVDERGKTVRLGEIIDRPTLFLPIYFYCPDICSRNLANLAIALNSLSFEPGRDFRVIALSFNEKEDFQDAAQAKRNYLKILDKGFPAGEWFFLTGKKDAIKAATDAVGFRFKRVDDETFVHPAALMAIAKDGKIIRYVYGSFLAGDIDMALSSAQSGTVARSVRRLLDFCFNYNPKTSRSVFQTVKIAILVLFGLTLVSLWLYYRGRGRKGSEGSKGDEQENRAAGRENSITQDKQS